MAALKLLIKFAGASSIANVVSGLALEPELLLLVGYGDFLSQTARSRYNFFFHRRKVKTIVMEPATLSPFMEPDAERRLADLLQKYEKYSPVIDIADADEIESMALGAVLRGHREWNFPVLDYRIEDGVFLPQRNADRLRNLVFPSLLGAEIRFLNERSPINWEDHEVLTRKDLSHDLVRAIQSIDRLTESRPDYWSRVARALRKDFGSVSMDREEVLADESQVTVPDEALEKLLKWNLISAYSSQHKIVRIRFPSPSIRRLLFGMDRADAYRAFLKTAQVRDFDRRAAYRDLTLIDGSFITGIRQCLPYIIGVVPGALTLKEVYHFELAASEFYGDPIKKILLSGESDHPEGEIERACRHFQMQLTDINHLSNLLKPR